MATRVDLPPLPQFDPLSDQSSLSQRWKSWTKRFETYLLAANITDDQQKRAMLLYQAGSATQDILKTLADTGTDYATAKKKLDDYFSGMWTSKYSNFVKPHSCLVKAWNNLPQDYVKSQSTVNFMTSIKKSNRQSYSTVVQNAWDVTLSEKMPSHLRTCWPEHAAWKWAKYKPLGWKRSCPW